MDKPHGINRLRRVVAIVVRRMTRIGLHDGRAVMPDVRARSSEKRAATTNPRLERANQKWP